MKGRLWFPAKRYGWGWGLPICWQGWVVFVVYLAAIGSIVTFLRDRHGLYEGSVLLATAILVLICWRKGEKPKWRWGGDEPPGPRD